MKHLLLLCLAFTSALPAAAQEVSLGIGYSDFARPDATDDVAIALEAQSRPLALGDRAYLALAGATVVQAKGDLWIGAGLAIRLQPEEQWFFEISSMPGYYREASVGTELGGAFQFRTLLAIGRNLGEGRHVALAATHKSNANFAPKNPGVNTVLLRYGFGF